MIAYSDKLVLSEKLRSKPEKVEKIKNKIKTHSGLVGTTIIALSSSEKDVFDIHPPFTFKSEHFQSSDIFVVGIAESTDAAMEMVKELTMEYIDKKPMCSMREYFISVFK